MNREIKNRKYSFIENGQIQTEIESCRKSILNTLCDRENECCNWFDKEKIECKKGYCNDYLQIRDLLQELIENKTSIQNIETIISIEVTKRRNGSLRTFERKYEHRFTEAEQWMEVAKYTRLFDDIFKEEK